MIPKSQVTRQLLDLGVQPGGVLLVHCAFSVKPVEDGPEGLIAALRSALGPEGTLVMPSMTADDDHPFDPRATSCIGMGIVAQTFWQLPGVLRSDSPHAFAAAGPQAARITARTRWMSRMDWTARLAGYMNWMGRCCCSAWITPPILPSPGRVYETRPLPAQEIRDPA